jgi:hypothetical protein
MTRAARAREGVDEGVEKDDCIVAANALMSESDATFSRASLHDTCGNLKHIILGSLEQKKTAAVENDVSADSPESIPETSTHMLRHVL